MDVCLLTDGEYKAQVNVSVEETGVKPNLSLIDPGIELFKYQFN